jgi:NDP-sugar pyrophosphorylase family protein
MRGMILAAGYGTRLWPLTADRTKPALPFLGKPIVGYVAEYLGRYGCRDIVVNLHHKPESVRRSLGDGSRFGVHLEYVEEETILGTSGALDNARHLLDSETFIVVNGKIVTDIDLSLALETHRRSEALATLVLLPNRARDRFSMVETLGGCVTKFGGMPRHASDNDSDKTNDVPLMFTGIQILEPKIFDYIPRTIFSHSTLDVYPQAIARGERISAHIAEGMWHELSTIHRYLDVSLELLSRTGRNVEQGTGCLVSESAELSEALLWDNVRIEEGARIHHAVLADDVVIPSGEVIDHAAVVRADLVRGTEPPSKALKGEFRGDNFVVSLWQ